MEAYIAFVQNWIHHAPTYFWLITLGYGLVCLTFFLFLGASRPKFLVNAVYHFFLVVSIIGGFVLSLPTISFFVPKPYDGYLIQSYGPIVLVFIVVSIFIERSKRSNQPNKSQPAIQPQPASPMTLPSTPQPFSDSGPVKGMALRLKRGERTGRFGKIIFTLDARMDVSAENRALIEKYKLGNRVIYESANREKYRDKARQNVANTADQPGAFSSPGAQAWGFAKTLGRVAAAGVNATVASLSLRITVNSLMAGVHVECEDMTELLDAEDAIMGAGLNLKAELAAATTFTGQEQVIDL